jgi:membrane protein implicated in regulation of membrane protease activity
MGQDVVLFLAVFAVWLGLAILYAALPMLAMPGYALVWGLGSLVFLALALILRRFRPSAGARCRGRGSRGR